MRKIALIFGGTEGTFKNSKIFEKLEKIYTKKSINTFISKDRKIKLKVWFVYGIKKDKVLNFFKEIVKRRGIKLPKTGTEKIADIKRFNPDIVLFFGICLGLKGKVNQHVFPTNYSCLELKKYEFLKIEDIKTSKNIKIKNLFAKGNLNSKNISSNGWFDKWLLGPSYLRNGKEIWTKIWKKVQTDLKKKNFNLEGKEAAEKWMEINFGEPFRKRYVPKISEFGETLEMESYLFAKTFPEKIGIMLQISDTPKIPFEEKNINWKKFDKRIIKELRRIENKKFLKR